MSHPAGVVTKSGILLQPQVLGQPWREIVVSREEVPRNLPAPPTDMLGRVVTYRVPPDKVDDVAQHDGSGIVERTKGTMAARCDREERSTSARGSTPPRNSASP